jgi:orotidine-5'-phosphate decarboxylase
MTNRDVIIACDFSSAEETFRFLDLFKNEARKPFLKIGMELFYAEGPEIVREIKRRGHRIFLDLKLHDIPNTVKKAMAVLSRLDVDMCNVHAAGTIEMMRAAVEGLTRPDGTRPLLIAVTQLTSTSEERMQRELLISASINDTIVKYAQNTREAGLDGVVCSPLEAGMVKAACGKEFLTVTPGVRFADGEVADQVRVTTPARAREIGSDYIVVGRPITASRSRGGLSPVRGGVREIECATVGSISGGTEGRAALRPGSSDTDGIRVVRQLSKMGLGAWSSRNFGRHGCCRIVRTECAPNCGDRRGRLPRQARNKFYSKSRKL